MKLSTNCCILTLFAFMLLCVVSTDTRAQTSIEVGAGQILTQADLHSGLFQGMSFELGPATIFDIDYGGVVDRVGEAAFPNRPFDFSGATVNVSNGGTFGDARGGPPSSVSNVSLNLHDNGTVLRSLRSGSGATVNVYGGIVDSGYAGLAGSTTNIFDGLFEDNVAFHDGSVVNIVGGQFVLSVAPLAGSNMTISGGEFAFNGESAESQITGPGVLSGTYSDGKQFVISFGFNSVANVILEKVDLPAIDTSPIVADFLNPYASTGIRKGQTLILREGTLAGPRFLVDESTLLVEGGDVGHRPYFYNADVIITDGDLGSSIDANYGTSIDFRGGIAGSIDVRFGSTAVVRDGTLGIITARTDSVVKVYGGSIAVAGVEAGGTLDVSGGSISSVSAGHEGSINLFVKQLFLDGVPQVLGLGETTEVNTGEYSLLEAILADGSSIQFPLTYHPKDSITFVPTATLTVTQVPEPSSAFFLSVGAALLFGVTGTPRTR